MKKIVATRLAAIPAFVAATTGAAYAALPSGVDTAITAAQGDMLAAIGLVIGAMVAVWGLLKLASKLGWR